TWLCKSIPDLPAFARQTVPAAAAIRTRPLFAWTSLVHVQRAAIKLFAIERAHRGIGLGVVIHCDEREPARFARHLVHHQMDFVDGAMWFEQILKIVLGRHQRQTTHVQSHCVWTME